jgi:hypothetical protein
VTSLVEANVVACGDEASVDDGVDDATVGVDAAVEQVIAALRAVRAQMRDVPKTESEAHRQAAAKASRELLAKAGGAQMLVANIARATRPSAAQIGGTVRVLRSSRIFESARHLRLTRAVSATPVRARSACTWTRPRSRAPRRRTTARRHARSSGSRSSDGPEPVGHRRRAGER